MIFSDGRYLLSIRSRACFPHLALADRCPGPVGILAGGPPGDLRAGVEVDRVSISAALQAALDIGRPRNNAAVPPGAGIAPTHRRSRRAQLKRIDLRLV